MAHAHTHTHSAPVILAPPPSPIGLDLVSALCHAQVLIDAGGESYKSPPPEVVGRLSNVALNVKRALAAISARLPSETLRINNIHRAQPGWAPALGAYLASGGYARRVGRSHP